MFSPLQKEKQRREKKIVEIKRSTYFMERERRKTLKIKNGKRNQRDREAMEEKKKERKRREEEVL